MKKELEKLVSEISGAQKEFYEKAIEGLEKLSNEDLAEKNVFQYLVDIDKEVHEKYKKLGKNKDKDRIF